jgi:hypothetical protein
MYYLSYLLLLLLLLLEVVVAVAAAVVVVVVVMAVGCGGGSGGSSGGDVTRPLPSTFIPVQYSSSISSQYYGHKRGRSARRFCLISLWKL